jgi:hypothetical protein
MKKILFAMALLIGCDTDPTMMDEADANVTDARVIDAGVDADTTDATVPDAPPLQPGCGQLNAECCYLDGAPPGCDDGLACEHQEAQPQSVCHPKTCAGDHPGLCEPDEACVYSVDAAHYECVHCGNVGEACCGPNHDHCEGQELGHTTCTGICVAL